jgi:raffinose/stachyose/melibiose transport system permease protein
MSQVITVKTLKKIGIGLVALAFFAPFYISLLYSFKTPQEVAMGKLALPTRLYLNNFIKVVTENPAFATGLTNTVVSTIPVVIILTLFCSMASYVLARNTRGFYGFLYYIFLGAMLIPFQSIMFPLYLNFKIAGLSNSLWGFILARIGFQVPLCILVITGFIKTVPRDLEEAAQIDGANVFITFWKVIFPLMLPVNVTMIVLNTLFTWNDFYVALVLLQTNSVRTLPLAQFYYFGENTVELNLAFAFFTLSMLPVIILYLFTQKYIVSGIMSGAVKG